MRNYNKLVRDRIPEIIINNGEEPVTRILDDYNYKIELERKLFEEYNEVLKSTGTEKIEELADMLEVMVSIAKLENYSLEDIILHMNQKRNTNGGFENKIFLENVK